MTLDYIEGGTVKTSIIYYIYEIIAVSDKSDSIGRGIKTISAPEYLYKFDKYFENLSNYKSKVFHNLVTKTLYTTKMEIPDTITVVAFLTTIFREPNTFDWGEIFHLINYIRGARYIPLVLSTNGSIVPKWWICKYYGTKKHAGTYAWRNFHGKRIYHRDLYQVEY